MSPCEGLEDILENRTSLTEVIYFEETEYQIVYGLSLNFSGKYIYISVCDEDDTIVIGDSFPENFDLDLSLKKVLHPEPWINAYGKPLIWYWYMENNQGYQDGFQFEFSTSKDEVCICIQMIGIASQLSIRSVTEMI